MRIFHDAGEAGGLPRKADVGKAAEAIGRQLRFRIALLHKNAPALLVVRRDRPGRPAQGKFIDRILFRPAINHKDTPESRTQHQHGKRYGWYNIFHCQLFGRNCSPGYFGDGGSQAVPGVRAWHGLYGGTDTV